MGNNYNILWSKDAADDFFEIISYIKYNSSMTQAVKIYDKIIKSIDILSTLPNSGKIVDELTTIGINEIHEIVERPWRIFYRIEGNTVYILSILDGRRNIEEILYKKVIDGKIN
jgi:toxin ParE1/3/4